ncbi:MAG: hypothetical protein HC894_20025 [Microcoleus sp. SM1_3_4]|nr:hypothetical protein [Microcoleus sp. SM1_3_4]
MPPCLPSVDEIYLRLSVFIRLYLRLQIVDRWEVEIGNWELFQSPDRTIERSNNLKSPISHLSLPSFLLLS